MKRGSKAGAILRALGHRNYRLYFFGQGVSLIGTWMQQIAMTWLVYRLSGSAFFLGLVGFAGQIPAFFLASRQSVLGLGKQMVMACGVLGSGMIGFSLSRGLGPSLVLLVFTGFAMIVQMAASNTILQTIVDEDKRGRVMSFYTMAFLGTAPLGSLLAGTLASRIGAPATVQLGGLVCLLTAGIVAVRLPALRELVRPIYRRIGILPEVAAGIQCATEWPVPPED